jgi:hypothetical protein
MIRQPRWLDENTDFKIKKRKSKKNEQRLAAELGGRTFRGSGNEAWHCNDPHTTAKGDIKTPSFVIEHKMTVRKSLSLKYEWLKKVAEGAKQQAKDPALIVTFESQDGRKKEDFVVLPLEVFKRLLALPPE